MNMRALGIDLGGSGFRLGVFDTVTGSLVGDFVEQGHEDVSDPAMVQASMAKTLQALEWRGPIGIGFPGVVVNDVVETAPNLGDAWVGTDFSSLHPFHEGQVSILNDADAVALGELYFGVGHQGHDKVLTLTIGTGLGTTVHENGTLVPNLEYGRLPHPARRFARRTSFGQGSKGGQPVARAVGWPFSGGLGCTGASCRTGIDRPLRRHLGALEHHQAPAFNPSDAVACSSQQNSWAAGRSVVRNPPRLSLNGLSQRERGHHLHGLPVLDFPEIFL